MKSLFKKIMLSALYVLLGTSMVLGKAIQEIEIIKWPQALPFNGKAIDLTALRINVYYDEGDPELNIGYNGSSSDWSYTVSPAIKDTEGKVLGADEVVSITVSYKNFALDAFSSDAKPTDALPLKRPRHTAHFVVNGKMTNIDIPENCLISIPNEIKTPSLEGMSFFGWTKEDITIVKTTEPTIVNPAAQNIGTQDATFYAVFSITNEYDDIYTLEITPDNFNASTITAYTADGKFSKEVEINNKNVSKSGDKMSFNGGTTTNRGYICNTKALNLTDAVVITGSNSNITTYYAKTETPNSGSFSKGTSTYFNVKCTGNASSKKGEATKITVKFSESRSETFYVTSQPTIKFAATDANDVEEGEKSYYATFSCPENVKINSNTIEAYNITVTDKEMTLVDVTTIGADEQLHLSANTGYLLKVSGEGTFEYNFEKTNYGTANADNMLVPCVATGEYEPTKSGDYYYYKLAYGDNSTKSKLGFWWGADKGGVFKVKAGGAILAVPQQTQAASLMRGFSFEEKAENETGLAEEMIIESKPSAIFNLSGQRVNSVNKSGLYIVNGKTQWINAK